MTIAELRTQAETQRENVITRLIELIEAYAELRKTILSGNERIAIEAPAERKLEAAELENIMPAMLDAARRIEYYIAGSTLAGGASPTRDRIQAALKQLPPEPALWLL